jgi:hypothetical protein
MLQKLTDEIAECYRHARECHERAKQSHDPATKEDLFNMERRWLTDLSASCPTRLLQKNSTVCGPGQA